LVKICTILEYNPFSQLRLIFHNDRPSTFDTEEDKQKRILSVAEKRVQGLVTSLHAVNAGTNPENDPGVVDAARRNVKAISRALRSKDPQQLLTELRHFLCVDAKLQKGKKVGKPYLKECPGAVLKSIVTALGGEGVPNIFLINRLNVNEISTLLEKVLALTA